MNKVKIAIVAVAVVGLSISANAQLSIGWGGPSGFSLGDGSVPLLSGGDAVAQLLWSASSNYAPASDSGPTGDNVVLQFISVTEAGTGNPFGAGFGSQFDDPTFQTGSVFVRVFEGGANPLTPGTFYFDGPLFATVDNPVPPQTVTAGASGSGSGDFGTIILDQQVIPEPSVFAMLGLGGLFLMIRRRFINS